MRLLLEGWSYPNQGMSFGEIWIIKPKFFRYGKSVWKCLKKCWPLWSSFGVYNACLRILILPSIGLNSSSIWKMLNMFVILHNYVIKRPLVVNWPSHNPYQAKLKQVQIEKKGKKKKSREEIFYQMKVFFGQFRCRKCFFQSARCP